MIDPASAADWTQGLFLATCVSGFGVAAFRALQKEERDTVTPTSETSAQLTPKLSERALAYETLTRDPSRGRARPVRV